MRQSLRATLLWQGLSLLCYLVGMVLFLVVAGGAFLAPPAGSLANLTTGEFVLVLLSVALLAGGGLLGWKAGGFSPLVMGYPATGRDRPGRDPPGSRSPLGEPTDGGPPAPDGDDVAVRCPHCGARNDRSRRNCQACSSRLPE